MQKNKRFLICRTAQKVISRKYYKEDVSDPRNLCEVSRKFHDEIMVFSRKQAEILILLRNLKMKYFFDQKFGLQPRKLQKNITAKDYLYLAFLPMVFEI